MVDYENVCRTDKESLDTYQSIQFTVLVHGKMLDDIMSDRVVCSFLPGSTGVSQNFLIQQNAKNF